MRFSHLDITGFRNLTSVSLELAPGLNLFFGDNGAGKTALLEAVHLLCRGRSFRTQRGQGLIQRGEDMLVVRGRLEAADGGTTTLAISKSRAARTELRLNGHPERRLSRIARITPVQVMLPDIGEVVFGGPSRRRSWLDWGMFHVKPDYLVGLRDYLRALRQRNALLKEGAGRVALQAWNEETARLGMMVDEARRAYLDQLNPFFEAVLQTLAPELIVDVRYTPGWPQDQSLHKLLGEGHGREVKYGSTLWGPHRADLQLRTPEGSAGAVLSRGQGKMVASALQMAQAALLADREQRSTVFLIDDAGAELDAAHNERFFGLLTKIGGQILATTTRDPGLDQRNTTSGAMGEAVFHVEHGSVTRRLNE